ncbi:MAG: nucleotidyltransferase family protein [Planctomycetes bacterium]|nr:nucleotidyltransferase family protein [Planctomycetota bacterium]
MADPRTRRSPGNGPGHARLSIASPTPPVPIYEELLNRDPRWALSEGSRHFEESSAVFEALHRIAARLKEIGIPYAVVGGMALFRHGLRRFTEDVDLLVRRDDLKVIHDRLRGLGYLPPFATSKHLRDTQLGVKIEFLTTGDYPGDGKPKPVSFPEPLSVSFEADGINYINLPTLVELKLASGMTNPGRLKDLSDVLELIKTLNLPIDFANPLNAFVRDKFQELWREARRRYVTIWRNKWLTAEAKSVEEMIRMLRSAADRLDQMRKDGVVLDDESGVGDDYARLVTTDPTVAEKYGLVEESEYWEDEEEDAEPSESP